MSSVFEGFLSAPETLEAFGDVGLVEPANVVNSPSLLLMIAYLSRGDAVAAMSEEVAQLLTQPPVSAGFSVLSLPREVRVSPYYLLALKRQPLTPLAARLRELVIHYSADGAPDSPHVLGV